MGDLLFAAVNVARLLGEDPESCLKAANRKFRARFRYVEERLEERGRTPAESSLEEMEALWQEAKARQRSGGWARRGGDALPGSPRGRPGRPPSPPPRRPPPRPPSRPPPPSKYAPS